MQATATVIEQMNGLSSEMAAAIKRNGINARETASLRSRWEKLKGDMEGFVLRCETGGFKKLPSVPVLWTLGWWLATGDLPELSDVCS